MNPIHFQGLNCYHDCVISIAHYFGLHYPAAFATLWSETDFRYDPYREAYLTKRMITNLEIMGAKVTNLSCLSQKDVEKNISMLEEGEFVIIGMDAFYIPWNQFYQMFHGSHYFIAQNMKAETLLCVDPTYNQNNEQMARQEIIDHTFDMCRVNKVAEQSLSIEAIHEAREVLSTHPTIRPMLLSRIYDCVNGEGKEIIMLAKYMDTIISNRYLYRFFLENQSLPYHENHLFFNNEFFLEWKAVKNGLYKAAVSRSNERLINDVCNHFNHLIDEEMAMAEKIMLIRT